MAVDSSMLVKERQRYRCNELLLEVARLGGVVLEDFNNLNLMKNNISRATAESITH